MYERRLIARSVATFAPYITGKRPTQPTRPKFKAVHKKGAKKFIQHLEYRARFSLCKYGLARTADLVLPLGEWEIGDLQEWKRSNADYSMADG
jgi:hypothetical protein